jgi:hypothetical protein
MYQIENITPNELSKVKIKNQDRITELTGSKLDLQKAYEVIKDETKGFKEKNEKALQADELFAELLKLNGISTTRSSKEKDNQIKLKEQERTRALKLLELELQLAA